MMDERQQELERNVTIWVAGALAAVRADVAPLITGVLGYSVTRFETTGSNVQRLEVDVATTCELSDGLLRFGAGQIPAVEKVLHEAGHSVEVHPWPRAESPVQDSYLPALDETDELGRAFIAAINREPRGIIKLPDGESVGYWVSLVLKWFRHIKIIIPVPTIAMIDVLSSELLVHYGLIGQLSTRHHGPQQRVTVTNYDRFRFIDPRDYQIVIVPDADVAAARRHWDFGWERILMSGHRVYGFVRGEQRSEYVRDRLEIGFRTEIFAVPHRRGLRATVHVEMASYTTPPLALDDEGLNRKRLGIWHNQPRNAAIAEIAKGLLHRDVESLWKYGLVLDKSADYLTRLLGGFSIGVVVLVESLEHAQQLAPLLPKFAVCTGTETPAAGPFNAIMTTVYANKLGRLPGNAIIRADGDAGPVPLRDFPPYMDGYGPRDVLLVDLADEYDDNACAAVYERLTHYKRQEYELDSRAEQLLQADPPTIRRRQRR